MRLRLPSTMTRGLPVLDLMFGDVGEAHDGEDVTCFSLEGSRAVEDDLARTGIAGMA